MPSIGYLGPKGTFSEEALYLFTVNHPELAQASFYAFSSIPHLLYACERKEIDWAFVPLENSSEGQVGATMDTLRQTENLLIFQEYIHPVQQCLLTVQPIKRGEIEKIYSHEQSLGQCREYLTNHMSGVEQIICLSNAEAARIVAATKDKSAAIGPKRAAQLYNLYCQEENIQDTALNATRFILVGDRIADMSGNDKTSLLLITDNSPGSLYRVLHEFAVRQINLTRIESRPSKRQLGEYVFYIDVDGYVFSPPLQEALGVLKEKKVLARLLGSYPKAKHPEIID